MALCQIISCKIEGGAASALASVSGAALFFYAETANSLPIVLDFIPFRGI